MQAPLRRNFRKSADQKNSSSRAQMGSSALSATARTSNASAASSLRVGFVPRLSAFCSISTRTRICSRRAIRRSRRNGFPTYSNGSNPATNCIRRRSHSASSPRSFSVSAAWRCRSRPVLRLQFDAVSHETRRPSLHRHRTRRCILRHFPRAAPNSSRVIESAHATSEDNTCRLLEAGFCRK